MLNKKIILNTFLDLVKIDSPSGCEKEVAKYIIGYFKKINIAVRTDGCGNVIAVVSGIGNPLFLSAHMDTVEPGRGVKPIIKGDVIKTDGTTVLGADDKAGITAILEAVKYLKAHNIKHRSLEIVFTKEEETTFRGALKLNFEKLKARQGIIIDSCNPLGYILTASPYVYQIEIRVVGKSAHSGIEPEKGINAIAIVARAISQLKIGRINKSTTTNIGIVNGGSAVNAVPETVIIKAEARSHNPKEAQEQIDLINKAFKKQVRKYGAKLFFKTKLICHGFKYSSSDSLIKEISLANKKVGLKTVFHSAGSASDANIFTGKKIKVIDISNGGTNAHTIRETIKISELEKLTEFIITFVREKKL